MIDILLLVTRTELEENQILGCNWNPNVRIEITIIILLVYTHGKMYANRIDVMTKQPLIFKSIIFTLCCYTSMLLL